MKSQNQQRAIQEEFNFSRARQRPLIASLPAKIDTYEEEVARFFKWQTDLEYYATIDQIVDFVVNTGRTTIVVLVSDTATFALPNCFTPKASFVPY